eukprot:TRINITY_DN5702_c0_g1_i1.p1 TRINITY_DN5702_c0_g1~~TRINITY_DN5702_c0_g1_i1.p1  ORF type:complete len:997 (+),score=198.33 TRINITY_DN5702_c0_g1_i1:141-3131(+)
MQNPFFPQIKTQTPSRFNKTRRRRGSFFGNDDFERKVKLQPLYASRWNLMRKFYKLVELKHRDKIGVRLDDHFFSYFDDQSMTEDQFCGLLSQVYNMDTFRQRKLLHSLFMSFHHQIGTKGLSEDNIGLDSFIKSKNGGKIRKFDDYYKTAKIDSFRQSLKSPSGQATITSKNGKFDAKAFVSCYFILQNFKTANPKSLLRYLFKLHSDMVPQVNSLNFWGEPMVSRSEFWIMLAIPCQSAEENHNFRIMVEDELANKATLKNCEHFSLQRILELFSGVTSLERVLDGLIRACMTDDMRLKLMKRTIGEHADKVDEYEMKIKFTLATKRLKAGLFSKRLDMIVKWRRYTVYQIEARRKAADVIAARHILMKKRTLFRLRQRANRLIEWRKGDVIALVHRDKVLQKKCLSRWHRHAEVNKRLMLMDRKEAQKYLDFLDRKADKFRYEQGMMRRRFQFHSSLCYWHDWAVNERKIRIAGQHYRRTLLLQNFRKWVDGTLDTNRKARQDMLDAEEHLMVLAEIIKEDRIKKLQAVDDNKRKSTRRHLDASALVRARKLQNIKQQELKWEALSETVARRIRKRRDKERQNKVDRELELFENFWDNKIEKAVNKAVEESKEYIGTPEGKKFVKGRISQLDDLLCSDSALSIEIDELQKYNLWHIRYDTKLQSVYLINVDTKQTIFIDTKEELDNQLLATKQRLIRVVRDNHLAHARNSTQAKLEKQKEEFLEKLMRHLAAIDIQKMCRASMARHRFKSAVFASINLKLDRRRRVKERNKNLLRQLLSPIIRDRIRKKISNMVSISKSEYGDDEVTNCYTNEQIGDVPRILSNFPPMSHPWTLISDDDDNKYFHNFDNGDTQWEVPLGITRCLHCRERLAVIFCPVGTCGPLCETCFASKHPEFHQSEHSWEAWPSDGKDCMLCLRTQENNKNKNNNMSSSMRRNSMQLQLQNSQQTEIRKGEVWCGECKMVFCAQCSSATHRKHQRRWHIEGDESAVHAFG